MIPAHGGKLVNCLVDDHEKPSLLEKAKGLERIVLNEREETDLMMLADGALSPLNGFMTKKQYHCVVKEMHLPDGLPFSLPITLQVSRDKFSEIKKEKELTLVNSEREVLGLFQLQDTYEIDKENESKKVFLTSDIKHPSVAYINERPEMALGGEVRVIHYGYRFIDFPDLYLTPSETRKKFQERNWTQIVAFQTRNPIHRAHEYLQKCALEMVDGLFLHPLMGKTKSDDIPGKVRMLCYQELMKNYFPKDRILLGIYPAYMRYGGPREAIFHALVRKNYGCTHIIIGRDHAGVGTYYGTFDAQKIFDQFDPEKLGITPIKFEHSFYCKKCSSMTSPKTCPHEKDQHVFLSGTKVRELLQEGKELPEEFTRKEIAKILLENSNR